MFPFSDSPYTPPSGPPQISAPKVFSQIGLDRLKEMTWQQYQALAKSEVSHLFPSTEEELKAASERQAEFLCGVLGGPPLYQQKYGHPRMRARHLPFAIDEHARQVWLRCFREAFSACDELGLPTGDRDALLVWIDAFSAWMVNKKSS